MAAGMDVVHDAATTPRCLASSGVRAAIETPTGLYADGHDATATEISTALSDAGRDAIATLIAAGSKREDGRNNFSPSLFPSFHSSSTTADFYPTSVLVDHRSGVLIRCGGNAFTG